MRAFFAKRRTHWQHGLAPRSYCSWKFESPKMPQVKRPKPNAILLDITGAVAKKAFMAYSDESKAFLRTHIKSYVAECWGKSKYREFRLAVNFLRQTPQTKGNHPVSLPPPIADISATPDEQMDSIVNNVLWRLDKDGITKEVGYFFLYMSEWGYKKGLLQTPIYDEAAAVLKKWKKEDNIKLYVTLGSAQFLRSVFSKTTHGDLLGLIEGHMNLMSNDGTRKDFSSLSQLVNEPPSKILFITRLPIDARLANVAKIPAVIIVRQDFDPKAVDILQNMEKKAKSKAEKVSPEVEIDELREAASNMESLGVDSGENDPLNPVSRVTERDIRQFPVIQRLDELVWTSSDK